MVFGHGLVKKSSEHSILGPLLSSQPPATGSEPEAKHTVVLFEGCNQRVGSCAPWGRVTRHLFLGHK